MLYFLLRFLVAVGGNALGLALAKRWIAGFTLQGGGRTLLVAALVFTLLNYTVKPIAKFFLSPLIVFTLGAALLAINAGMLLLLDFASDGITIEGTRALLFSTLLISLVHVILHRVATFFG
jgi:putative membrane protein